ncbi:hypothetical protein [Nocardia sp. NPDC052112]|uniref:hypothetical protein n=1 Tax=Nocardia sp. NPDC052112 TaxID=3155646 RepID=UPI00343A4BCC
MAAVLRFSHRKRFCYAGLTRSDTRAGTLIDLDLTYPRPDRFLMGDSQQLALPR